MLSRLLALCLGLALICHAGFYWNYNTLHPCRAAVARLVSEDSPMFIESAEKVVGRQKARRALRAVSKKMVESRGFRFCYRIAIFGPPGEMKLSFF